MQKCVLLNWHVSFTVQSTSAQVRSLKASEIPIIGKQYYRPTWESSTSVDTFYSEFNIHIFHFRVNFSWNFFCLHDIEQPNLEICAHVDIKILRNKFKHWLQIGQAMILHTLKLVCMYKESICFFLFEKYLMSKLWKLKCQCNYTQQL